MFPAKALAHRVPSICVLLCADPPSEAEDPPAPWYHCIPNVLSLLRCAAIPVLMWLFCQDPYMHNTVFGLFAVTCLTDFFDGYLARKWNATSAFGAFLDPVADKLMVAAALVLLAGRFGRVVAVPAAIILVREVAVSALREWMAEQVCIPLTTGSHTPPLLLGNKGTHVLTTPSFPACFGCLWVCKRLGCDVFALWCVFPVFRPYVLRQRCSPCCPAPALPSEEACFH